VFSPIDYLLPFGFPEECASIETPTSPASDTYYIVNLFCNRYLENDYSELRNALSYLDSRTLAVLTVVNSFSTPKRAVSQQTILP